MLVPFVIVVILRCFVSRRIGFGLDLAILLMFVVLAKEINMPSVKNLYDLPIYFFIGLTTFYVSLLLTTALPYQYLLGVGEKINHSSISILSHAAVFQLVTAVHEEIIWRFIFQSYLISVLHVHYALAIFFIGTAFFLWHKNIYSAPIRIKAELLLFSIFLGWIFFLTQNILCPIAVHFVRNMFVKLNSLSEKSYG